MLYTLFLVYKSRNFVMRFLALRFSHVIRGEEEERKSYVE